MNIMKKKIVFFLIIFLFLFALADFSLAQCPPGLVEVEGKCVRALEITYPKIAGEALTEQRIIKEGLPGYVKYIFTLAVGLIGFVIFGVLIYNGIKYLTSTGDPTKMSDARAGIFYAFLGGLLLVSSVLIFNTINPQLAIMELPEVPVLETVVMPGVYICNYEVENIADIMKDYIDPQKRGEEQREAAKKLRAIMNVDNQNEKVCLKVNASANFLNFKVTEDYETIFIVPFISITPEGEKLPPEYKFGVILHQKENFKGKAKYYPEEDDDNLIYHQIDGYSAKGLGFTAYSVTLFQKPAIEPVGDGVTLYSGFNYNREEPEAKAIAFSPGYDDIMKLKAGDLGELKDNSRSISFSPPGSYLALLYKEDEFKDKCIRLYKKNPNLLDVLPTTGECKTGLWAYLDIFHWGDCKPVLGSMIVIKGTVL